MARKPEQCRAPKICGDSTLRKARFVKRSLSFCHTTYTTLEMSPWLWCASSLIERSRSQCSSRNPSLFWPQNERKPFPSLDRWANPIVELPPRRFPWLIANGCRDQSVQTSSVREQLTHRLMAARHSESVMHTDTPAKCDRAIHGSRSGSIFDLRACIRSGTRIAVAAGLLACFGAEALRASPPAVAQPSASSGKRQQIAAPPAGRQNTAGNAVLLPLPDEAGAALAETAATTQPAPVVTYRDGQLTIDAQNSTLAEVLKLVAEATGATINVPPGSGLEPMVEHAGPGPAKDVLKHLLNGSRFNFIIVRLPQRPQDPAQVLLSLQGADTGIPSPAPAPPQASTSSVLWTPPKDVLWTPPEDTSVLVLPPQYDESLTPPKEPVPPEARGELMREKARELLEKNRQQYPPQ